MVQEIGIHDIIKKKKMKKIIKIFKIFVCACISEMDLNCRKCQKNVNS